MPLKARRDILKVTGPVFRWPFIDDLGKSVVPDSGVALGAQNHARRFLEAVRE